MKNFAHVIVGPRSRVCSCSHSLHSSRPPSPSYYFCDLKPHAKLHIPTITPSGRQVTQAERREKMRKNAVNSGHLVSCQCTQAARINNAVNSGHLVPCSALKPFSQLLIPMAHFVTSICPLRGTVRGRWCGIYSTGI